MAKPGTKTFGSANVLLEQLTMACIVFLIHARMVGYGIMNLNHVFVQIIRYGIQEDVSLQESTVPMEEYGIPPFMHAHAQLVPSQISTNVILSQHVDLVNIITPSITNVSVLIL